MLELIQANAVLFTLIGVVLGASLPPILTWLTGRKKNKTDSETQLRSEMWAELKELRQRIDHLEAQNEVWRERTYKAEDSLALMRQKILTKGCDQCVNLLELP